MELKGILEAVLFATSKPLSIRQMSNLIIKAAKATPNAETEAFAALKEEDFKEAINQIRVDCEARSSGMMLQEVGGGYRLLTHPDAAYWVRQLFDEPKINKLSQPALETLAIIAYRQPMSRAEVEAVRGVSIDGVLDTLLDRGLVRSAGRSDAPGRPVLYETAPDFLEFFGLNTLDELPGVEELRRVAVPKPQEPVVAVETTGELPLQTQVPDETTKIEIVEEADPQDQNNLQLQHQDDIQGSHENREATPAD